MTTTTDERTIAQGARALIMSDLMQLAGAKAGPGDILGALRALSLQMVSATDDNVDLATLAAGFGAVTEERDCPRCGRLQYRRTDLNRDCGWWHEREPWGYQRACPGKEAQRD